MVDRVATAREKSPVVANAVDADIALALVNAISLIGCDVPDAAQKHQFVAYIRTHHPHVTCDEIMLAFEMAVAGKIDAKVDQHFGRFTMVLFERVIRKYYEKRFEITRDSMKSLPEHVITPDEQRQIMVDGLLNAFELIRAGKTNVCRFWHWEWMHRHGILVFNQDQTQLMGLVPGKLILVCAVDDIKMAATAAPHPTRQNNSGLMVPIREINHGAFAKSTARGVAVDRYFQRLIELNIELKTILK